jgi:hypothetical protein
MNYLHVAILEDFEKCLVSHTEEGLRQQVSDSLAKKSIAPLTNEEWADCVKGEDNVGIANDCLRFGAIFYYKTESKLGKKAVETAVEMA